MLRNFVRYSSKLLLHAALLHVMLLLHAALLLLLYVMLLLRVMLLHVMLLQVMLLLHVMLLLPTCIHVWWCPPGRHHQAGYDLPMINWGLRCPKLLLLVVVVVVRLCLLFWLLWVLIWLRSGKVVRVSDVHIVFTPGVYSFLRLLLSLSIVPHCTSSQI